MNREGDSAQGGRKNGLMEIARTEHNRLAGTAASTKQPVRDTEQDNTAANMRQKGKMRKE